jgi:hypothetical protein
MPALDSIRLMATTQAMRAAAAAAPAGAAVPTADTGFSLNTAFHDLLDIVNPLQHLPVVGTLYRALTDDRIGTVAKVAGDALYGGLWGAVGALADTAFEAVTGKDFGSTMLALAGDALGLDGADTPVAVASAQPQVQPQVLPKTMPVAMAGDGAGVLAFSSALASKGVDNELASRALYAYRRANGLVPIGLN